MEQFSPAELLELWLIEQSEINLQFEFWLTVTFAVIVASFVAGRRLNRNLRIFVAFLYMLAVTVFVSRWYYAANEAGMIKAALIEAGVPVVTPWITVFARTLLVAIGTAAGITFLLKTDLYYKPDK
jgi:hypothetical protein